MKRRFPRWRELKPFLRGSAIYGGSGKGRLARLGSITDVRAAARKRVPRAVFDYVDGAAEAELSIGRARGSFSSVEFRPRVLRDVSQVATATSLLGCDASFPVVCAPTGFTRMMNTVGETAVARAAAAAGIPYTLSTMGTTSPEDLSDRVPDGTNWFQLYVGRERPMVESLVDRAAAAGYSALMVTVDAPVAGNRLRDSRNGLTIPPTLTIRTMLGMARFPRWWFNVLTTEPLALSAFDTDEWADVDPISQMLDPAFDLDYLGQLRERWSGPLVVKGIQTVSDARAVVDLGADAIVLSNHGGRQLDRAPSPLLLLPDVVAEVGDRAQVYIDGGIMSGADIAIALAAGADAVLVGRAYLYGLMAGGEAGVARALEILRVDLVRTMQLLGVAHVDDLNPELIGHHGG